MTIEKTFKLTIRDQAIFLSEEEVSNLYQQCRYALNIKDIPNTLPLNPSTPSIPYPWYTPTYPSGPNYPYWVTSSTTNNLCNADNK